MKIIKKLNKNAINVPEGIKDYLNVYMYLTLSVNFLA